MAWNALHCTVLCSSWTPERDESQGSEVPQRLQATWAGVEVPRYPGALDPCRARSNPCQAIRCARINVVQCRAQQFHLRSFARWRENAAVHLVWASTCTTHNAPIPPSRRLGQPHCIGPHCMTLSSITLHCTTPRQQLAGLPFAVCPVPACQSRSQSVSSRLWYHPIPPATACPSVP